MNIIKWNEPVDVSVLGEKEKREVFLRMLKGHTHNMWSGEIVRKSRAKDKMDGLHIQLRKSTGEAQVVLHYGVQKSDRWRQHSKDPVVLVAQNGTAKYHVEDFAEMNLVVLEAKAVYDSLTEDKDNA